MAHVHAPPATDHPAGSMQLLVMSRFELRTKSSVISVPSIVERVFAFLAVREHPQLRSTIASTLWIDTTDDRAAANLRTALWKARQTVAEWFVAEGNRVALAPSVQTDLSSTVAQAKRLIRVGAPLEPRDSDPVGLTCDLLPEWDEEWILYERERLRQLRIHALEELCRKLSALGRSAEAVDAGLAAVAAEPLRESAQRALIGAYLDEGNVSESRRQYFCYRELLWEQLGLEPSHALRTMVGLTRKAQ